MEAIQLPIRMCAAFKPLVVVNKLNNLNTCIFEENVSCTYTCIYFHMHNHTIVYIWFSIFKRKSGDRKKFTRTRCFLNVLNLKKTKTIPPCRTFPKFADVRKKNWLPGCFAMLALAGLQSCWIHTNTIYSIWSVIYIYIIYNMAILSK